jgi:multidrug efflux pump subunit AcrA (membrane-fusion protein)
VAGATRRTLLVPASAVSLNGQMERVFVVGEGNRATLRIVKTGAARGTDVEILSGLSASERVVSDPPATLREGQPLEAQP